MGPFRIMAFRKASTSMAAGKVLALSAMLDNDPHPRTDLNPNM